MTEEKILEGNKIIADWKGIDYKSGNENYMYRPGAYIPLTEKLLQYHENYSWIMPIFFEIQSKFYCGGSIIENEVSFYTLGYCMDDIVSEINIESESMCQTIFRTCVKAIKLYNINPEKFISRK